MKIPFDLKFRPQIESGEYKVETRDGRSAKIIYWEQEGICPIVAVVENKIQENLADGRLFNNGEISGYDLFLIVPEICGKIPPHLMDIIHSDGFVEGAKATKDDFWDRGLECMVEKDIITGMKTIRAHGLRDALKREDIMSQLNIGDYIRLVFMKGGKVINE